MAHDSGLSDETMAGGTPDDIPTGEELLRAAAERIRRCKAGERHRVVYGFEDEEMDDFMYRMLENAWTRDLQMLADAYLATTPEGCPTDHDDC